MISNITGKIHSIETFGSLDGPGIRYVVFLQGCPLTCIYCHNPDSWKRDKGLSMTSSQLVEDALRYKSFIKRGGITLSGGEPLMQADFCLEVIEKAHKEGFSVAVDTSGGIPLETCREVILKADLLLLDIKSIDDNMCKKITGKTNKFAIDILELRERYGLPVWIRHVVVPTLTMNTQDLTKLADFLTIFKCIERIELLPFHKMGEYKWEELGEKYTLSHVNSPTFEEMNKVKSIFNERNLPVDTF